jgi:hypothetical protein
LECGDSSPLLILIFDRMPKAEKQKAAMNRRTPNQKLKTKTAPSRRTPKLNCWTSTQTS